MSEQKKKFRSRPSVVDEHRRRQIEAGGGRAIPHADMLMILDDLLGQSIRRAKHPFAMFKLQANLLLDLVDEEKFVAGYKAKVAELEASGAKTEDIQASKAEWMAHQRVRTALRDIGDGIAWRLLDFDRGVLTQLALRARKPHINIEGLSAELTELGEAFNNYDRVAILNDLTHYLKKGDITARVDDSSFEFIEVKSSNTKSSKLIRQRNDLIETVEFLNGGGKVENGERYDFLTLPVEPRSLVHVVEKVLARAESEGFANERIGEHLAVYALDFEAALRLMGDDDDVDFGFAKHKATTEAWEAAGDFILDVASMDRYADVQNSAPFSVYPLPTRQRVKLMTAALLLTCTVNVSAVLRYLEKRGWVLIKGPEEHAASFDPEKPNEVPVATLKKGQFTTELPFTWIGRVANEFLAPKTLGDMLDALLAAGPGGARGVFINLAEEGKQWD